MLLSTLTFACAGETDYSAEEQGGTTHAVVRIQQTMTGDGATQGDALAGFVQIPAGADLSQVLRVAGLSLQVPKKNKCWAAPEAEQTSPDLLEISQVELLEADSVEFVTPQGAQKLAPYAFPTIADLLRGVVYLSRDRTAEFPAGTEYDIVGRGINDRGIHDTSAGELSLDSAHESPPFVADLKINGVPAAEEMFLESGEVLDLSWLGSTRIDDLVVVNVESGAVNWTCSFADSEEFGSVPLLTEEGVALGAEGQSATISVHRIRTSRAHLTEGGLAAIDVTFDFALKTGVTFGSSTPPLMKTDEE